ncbi:hypothetical protein BDZ89DRAFT_1145029 [Hymenopellis radicata]|nr:hypothetical protein BDZ89DRAFT_1145029 [Hymenopellis radicata]
MAGPLFLMHSLFYDVQGLVASQVVEGVRSSEDISPGDLEDEFMSMDFDSSAMADHHDHPHEMGPSYAALDVNGEPYYDGDGGEEEDGDGGDEEKSNVGSKRKRNPSDDPMAEWKPFLNLFIEETLRRHGLGDATGRCRCSTCGKTLNVEDDVEGPVVAQEERAFRCLSCGDFLECSQCCLDRHARAPLHFIEIWRNGSWERTTLHELGLVYQIGHQGAPCTYPDATPRLMTVLHVTGYIRSPTVIATAGCRTAVGRVSRQWTFMQRARRSGVVLDPGGLAAARPGALIVECWACPRPGVNLPAGWDTVAQKFRYRYRRIVSADANFRMSNKLKPMAHPDPPLFGGLGVQMPQEQYEAWLRSYVTEEEVSNCAAFAALMQKDTRFTVGLRLGDLQKGERYKNTDFVLYTVLSRMGVKEAGVTYDIACQYKKHFFERIEALPAELRSLDVPDITWGLPVWHGNVHDPYCETSESLKYKVGMGKTDGEGPERVWSILNPMSYMTKEEHPGARHDDIEDKVNLHNFLKNVRSGYSLLRRLRLALAERTVQIQAFLAVEQGVTSRQRREWSQKVLDWIEDSTKPSPYIAPKRGVPLPTEAQARLDLRKQEEAESRIDSATTAGEGGSGNAARPSTTTRGKEATAKKQVEISETGFLIVGMRLEESKQRLRQDRAGTLTVDGQGKIHARRRAVMMREKEFRKWQERFMPGVKEVLEREEMQRRAYNRPLPPVEDTRLYMPSAFGDLNAEDRLDICAASLFDKEVTLRRGQCADALERLRTQLLSRRHFLNFRNGNIIGQNKTTRAAKLIERLGQSVKELTRKYWYCRDALRYIVGEEQCGEFRDLLDDDVDVPGLAEPDDDTVKELGVLEAAAEAGGVSAEDNEYVHECVRIEWSKALARKARWGEEVETLKEEMRRVLRSVKSEEAEWRMRSDMENIHLRDEERGGRRAYAIKQVKYRVAIRHQFIALWLAAEPSQGQKAGIMDGEAQKALKRLVDSENGVPGADGVMPTDG